MLRPTGSLRPAVIDVPLTARTDAEIALLAACVTLTPGSTAIALSADRTVMYVHLTNLGGGDFESARRSIKSGFERRILEILR
jgi:multicomponent Na+:H+ antiporter subunit E